jgi:hypothetical protein
MMTWLLSLSELQNPCEMGYQGSGIRDQGSGIRDQGSGIRDQGNHRYFSAFRFNLVCVLTEISNLIAVIFWETTTFSSLRFRWLPQYLLDDVMDVWQGVAMDSLKFHLGQPCLTLLRPACRPPLKRPYSCFRGGPPTGQAAYGRLLPLFTPHAVCLWMTFR